MKQLDQRLSALEKAPVVDVDDDKTQAAAGG